MRVFEWALAALVGWTAIGTLGTILAWVHRDRPRTARSVRWIAGVWVIYLATLFTVSARDQRSPIAPGQEECFDRTCLSVTGVRESDEFKGAGTGRLVQVDIQVRNAGDTLDGVEGLRAYLVTSDGRRWEQTPGVGGVRLTIRLPSGGTTVSRPVFRLPEGTDVSGLVLTRSHVGWRSLVIGDTDSMRHRRTILRLH